MDFVGPTIDIGKLLGGPIVRYLKCQINFNHYVKNFKESVENLKRKQRDIINTLEDQQVYGKMAKEEVNHWLKEVKDMTGPVAEGIENKIKKGGCLPRASTSLARLLKERIQEIEKLYKDGSQLPPSLVVDDPSALAVELPTSELQGHGDVKGKILTCLEGEEVAKLGVWGMGGVGKTTIMENVHNELLKKGKFKRIIWVTVSQNFNIYNLQEQIAYNLKEKLEEHQNTTNRAAMLSKMLEKNKPYLLILDDVWKDFKLKEVGILDPDVTKGCKLVLITRSQEIACLMDCRRRIKVETLSQEEALKLFLKKVGDTVLSDHGRIKKDLESSLKGIVDKCDGLPLAIVTLADSFKEKSEPWLWSVALNQLRGCNRNVVGTDDDPFKTLKFSYDHLKKPQIQNCFLYCALYPEHCNIPKEEIIEYWIDEGFMDEMETQDAMKDEGHDILKRLEDNSLLEFITDEDERDCVRMHDLVRDMALHIARTSPRFLVKAGMKLKEQLDNLKFTDDLEKVSLMCCEIEEIPSSITSSRCTKLTTLLLTHNKLSTIPESVFEDMPKLKILDLSFNTKLSSLPNSVTKLVDLTTLLLESTSLIKVPSLLGLRSLKKLNLKLTKIEEVPEGLGKLKKLKCLVLCGSNRYNILKIDKIPDSISTNLEELIVDWSMIELEGKVIQGLTKLKAFHGRFPTVHELSISLKCSDDRLSRYFIIVGKNFNILGEFMIVIKMSPRYEKIMVFNDNSFVRGNPLPLQPSVQVLCIEACHNIRSLNDFSAIEDETVTNLKRCCIVNCDFMEYVLSSWKNPIVQTLERLDLYALHNLDGLFEAKFIAKSPPPPPSVFSLKEVEITRCNKMKKLFPSRMVEYLQSLQKIVVKECEEMEEIIASDPKGGQGIIKFILPKLKRLQLWGLPALKSICSRRVIIVCDPLGVIEIENCKGLRNIPLHHPPYLNLSKLDNLDGLFEAEVIAMSPPTPRSFSSLRTVKIEGCKKIKKLFPSWKLVEDLKGLEKIDVSVCEVMEEIIASDLEEEGGNINLNLAKLKYLTLWQLPALKSICSKRVVMKCDSLEKIDIRHCNGLRRIPLYLDYAQPCPPSLKTIIINSREHEWWGLLEWDHINAKDVLQSKLKVVESLGGGRHWATSST